MGNIMASRWAFEAMMVTQFKDNPFEKQFYELDKTIAISEYKRVYFIPELESKLSYVLNNGSQWKNESNEQMAHALNLIKAEITSELEKVGRDKLPEIEKLVIRKFDSATYANTEKFLSTLKIYYSIKKENAQAKKDQLVASLTNTPEKLAQHQKAMLAYQNQTVMDAVKNITSPERIVEYGGRLIQKVYPIYDDEHRPRYWLDFSANLYQPTKYFASKTFDTFYFNIGVIWFMTTALFFTLYFDLLSRFVNFFENKRKYKKRRSRS